MCHNYYQQPGGEDQIFHDELALLEANGHEVFRFDLHNDTIRQRSGFAVACDAVWNHKVYRQIEHIVSENAIQIAHFHNTFPLISPAAYYAARRAGAAVVQTLHNYRLMCPGATLCRDEQSCSKCVGKVFPWPAVWHRCYRRSHSASAVIMSMIGVHHLRKTWHNAVTQYIVATDGARQRFAEGGFPKERIMIKPNFVHPDPGPGTGDGGYAVFVGRLAREKGIDVLLRAWSLVPGNQRLLVLGDGPLGEEVRVAAESDKRIEWLGWQPTSKVLDIVGHATCLIMPSVWIEGLPKTLLEASAKGTPAIASRLGAMAEVIHDEHTGLLFTPGAPDELAAKVGYLMSDTSRLNRMRQAVRAEYEKHYTAIENYRLLSEVYESALRRVRTE